MNYFKAFLIATVLFFSSTQFSYSQVLISLLLGDKLNSDKLEFGLAGGLNWSDMSELEKSKYMMDWHLGFYFDFKIKNNLFINTGVIVKSKLGAGDLNTYPVSQYLDSVFAGGTVDRKLNYFNVPGTVRYRFKGYLQVEGGIMLGLRYKSFDEFNNSIAEDDDLDYKLYNSDNYTRLDAGAIAGLGFKLQKGKGMNLFSRYYYGFVDVDKVTEGSQKNSSFYVGIEIPIGKGKAEKKKAEKAQEEQK